jgi:hypothetical protein
LDTHGREQTGGGVSDSEGAGSAGPPDYDQPAVSRIASRVEIVNVELIGAHFERDDDSATSAELDDSLVPSIRIGVEWHLGESFITVLPAFTTEFEDLDPEPYRILARFRLTYSIAQGDSLLESDVEQFAHWNAMFNAWPYWREYVSSTLNRGQLPRFVVPVMGVPAVRG